MLSGTPSPGWCVAFADTIAGTETAAMNENNRRDRYPLIIARLAAHCGVAAPAVPQLPRLLCWCESRSRYALNESMEEPMACQKRVPLPDAVAAQSANSPQ